MAEISLGQSINGSLTSDDPKFNSCLILFDRYTSTELENYRQVSRNFNAADNITPLNDTALAPNGQFYGIKRNANHNVLFRVDPTKNRQRKISQVTAGTSGSVTDVSGKPLSGTINAIEFAGDKLYALCGTITGDRLYTIEPTTLVATLVDNLPSGLLNKSGDLVYDAPHSPFLATAEGTPTNNNDLLQISIGNPAGATEISQIGFVDVTAINFENSQLTGISNQPDGTDRKIAIDPSTDAGSFRQAISGMAGISGSVTIVGANASSSTMLGNPNTSNFPTSVSGAIGTKSQGLAEGRTIDLTDYGNQMLKADITTKGDAAYVNNIGFYAVTDALTGRIDLGNGNSIIPGEAGYAKAAVDNAIANSLQLGKNDRKFDLGVSGGGVYAPIVIAQGSLADFVNKNSSNGGNEKQIHAYFNYVGANPDKFDHFRLTGPNTFAVEDRYGGGDKDFNDLIVNLNVRTA